MKSIYKIAQLITWITLVSSGAAYANVITPPYFENFDNGASGWKSYATTGTKAWKLAKPGCNFQKNGLSTFSWMTVDSDGYFPLNSQAYLQSPPIDLSDSNYYVLTFDHIALFNWYNGGGNIEYSIDTGKTWHLLNPQFDVRNGYNSNNLSFLQGNKGYYRDSYDELTHSSFSLEEFRGMQHLLLRFHFGSDSYNSKSCGWLIDNVGIERQFINLMGTNGNLIESATHVPDFELKTSFASFGQFFTGLKSKIDWYFSEDAVLDAGDSLFDSREFNNLYTNITETYTMPPGLAPGEYYLISKISLTYKVAESDTTDNIGYTTLKINPTYNLPYIKDFENVIEPYSSVGSWHLGEGNDFQMEGTHSGKTAWVCNRNANDYNVLFLPYLDLSTDSHKVMNLWYKSSYPFSNHSNFWINYSTNNGKSYLTTSGPGRSWSGEWYFANLRFPIRLDTCKYAKMTIKAGKNGLILDDLYIGPPKADLTIERDLQNRFTPADRWADTLKYFLVNSGLAPTGTTKTKFYWSTDSILDASDITLGVNKEISIDDTSIAWSSFYYSKPTMTKGVYYIFYELDFEDTSEEMREYNNTGFFRLFQQDRQILPYKNDFESNTNDWRHEATLGKDALRWDTINISVQPDIFPGKKAWIVQSDTNDVSRMHLYSPIFNLSGLISPVLQFDNTTDNLYIKSNITYSIDGGATWLPLDEKSNSYKSWYSTISPSPKKSTEFFENYEPIFSPDYPGFAMERNTRRFLDISYLTGYRSIQFRFNIASYPYEENWLMDNFKIIEGKSDLTVPSRQAIMHSSKAKELRFEYYLKNQGNFINDTSQICYYLSKDTVRDIDDYILGCDLTANVRPEIIRYKNKKFAFPLNQTEYKFLLFHVDTANSTNESNVSNNIQWWPLAFDSIKSYPYYNGFNDTIVHGWKAYSLTPDKIRIRRYLYPNENWVERIPFRWFNYFYCGKNSNSINNNIWYLESPSFDFTGKDNISIAFNLRSNGRDDYGGNLEYSLDGGNTWNVLGTNGDIYGKQWYNSTIKFGLDTEPGWSRFYFHPSSYKLPSFFNNQKYVVFRFKFGDELPDVGCDKHAGFIMDNFMVVIDSVPYVDLQTNDSCQSTIKLPEPVCCSGYQIPYSVTNKGSQHSGEIRGTFYWSKDAVIDKNDIFANYDFTETINPGETSTKSAFVSSPYKYCDTLLYLLYDLNSDEYGGRFIEEPLTSNNMGCIKVHIPNNNIEVKIAKSDSGLVCSDDTLVLSVPEKVKYQWSTGETTASISVNSSGTYKVSAMNVARICSYDTDSIYVEIPPAPAITINSGNKTGFCSGDSLLLTLVNDTNIVYYQWSNYAIGDHLYVDKPGKYFVNVETDKGCTGTSDTVFIDEDFPLAPYLNSNDTSVCFGDSWWLFPSDTGRSYIWSNGTKTDSILPSESNDYYVKIYNYCGVYSSDTVSVNFWNAVDTSLKLTGAMEGCEGDSIQLELMEGYSYRWNSGDTDRVINVAVSGNYQAVVIDTNNCVDSTRNVAVIRHSNPKVQFAVGGDSSFCENDSVLMYATGGNSYEWSNGEKDYQIYANETGEYWVIAFNKYGCSDTSRSILMQTLPAPVKPIITKIGDSLIATPRADYYQWLLNGLKIPGETRRSIYYQSTFSGYSVEVSNKYGCSAKSDIYGKAIGIKENATNSLHLNIYPNPSRENVTVLVKKEESIQEAIYLYVTDIVGKTVVEEKINKWPYKRQISALPNGVYLFKINSATGTLVTKQVIVIK